MAGAVDHKALHGKLSLPKIVITAVTSIASMCSRNKNVTIPN